MRTKSTDQVGEVGLGGEVEVGVGEESGEQPEDPGVDPRLVTVPLHARSDEGDQEGQERRQLCVGPDVPEDGGGEVLAVAEHAGGEGGVVLVEGGTQARGTLRPRRRGALHGKPRGRNFKLQLLPMPWQHGRFPQIHLTISLDEKLALRQVLEDLARGHLPSPSLAQHRLHSHQS